MSNWTSNLQYMTKFNPYVQQLPIDDMYAVGMEKQRRYDEGVEKIQTAIDTVAGMDVVRDVDKQYLHGKLNNLGNNFKLFAASDFSNYQLTRSLSGMVKHVGKDPGILNAVASTKKYREQKELMDKYNSEGKGNPANDLRFDKDANRWFNGKLKDTFNGSYVPPIDVWKKIKDVANEVGIDSSDVMRLYQTDEQGKILYDEKGNAKWNPIAAEQILKGKDPAKVLNAFQASLSAADFQQLTIEGEYQYAGYTPQMLQKELTSQANNQSEFINDKLSTLKSQLEKEKAKNNQDDEQKERVSSLEGQIKYFEDQSISLNNSLKRSIESINTNPDVVRGSLYTNNYLNSMSKVLSSQEVSTKYSVSPMWTITKDQFNMDMDVKKYNADNLKWQADYDLRLKTYMLKKKKAKEEAGGAKMTEGVDLPLSDQERKNIPYRVETNYNNKISEKNQLAKQITLDYYKRSNERLPDESKEVYENRLLKKIDEDRQKKGMDIDLFNNQISSQEASTNDNSVLMNNYRNTVRDAQVLNIQMKSAQNEAKRRAAEQGITVPDEKFLVSEGKGTTVEIQSGGINRSVNLTSQDILDYIYANPSSLGAERLGIRNPFVGKEYSQRTDEVKKRLSDKFGKNYDQIRNVLFGDIFATEGEGTLGRIGSRVNIMMGGQINPEVENMINMMNSAGYKKVKDIESDIYIEKGTLQQGKRYPVIQGKEKEADRNAKVATVVSSFEGVVKDKELDKIKDIALTNSNAVYLSVEPSADGSSRYMLSVAAKGEDTKSVEIDKNKFMNLSGFEPPVSMMKPSSIIMLDEQGTTNLSGDDSGKGNAATTAFFGYSDFPKFNDPDYKIKGDLKKVEGTNACEMKIYLFNKKGEYLRTLTYPDSEDPNYNQLLLPIYMGDRSYNSSLERSPIAIDATIVRQLMGENNGQ